MMNRPPMNPGFNRGMMGQGRPRPPQMMGVSQQGPQPPQIGGPLPPYNPQGNGTMPVSNGFTTGTMPMPNSGPSSFQRPGMPPPSAFSNMPAPAQGQQPPNMQAFLDYLRQRYSGALSGQQYG